MVLWAAVQAFRGYRFVRVHWRGLLVGAISFPVGLGLLFWLVSVVIDWLINPMGCQ